MREIKFRGKSKCDYKEYNITKGQWVYGYYYREVKSTNDEQSFKYISYIKTKKINHFVDIEVIPETIGQYTGLKEMNDINGQEIYEGDILNVSDEYCGSFTPVYVLFDKGEFKVQVIHRLTSSFDIKEVLCTNKIIGNIHDNPEIIEIEQDKFKNICKDDNNFKREYDCEWIKNK